LRGSVPISIITLPQQGHTGDGIGAGGALAGRPQIPSTVAFTAAADFVSGLATVFGSRSM